MLDINLIEITFINQSIFIHETMSKVSSVMPNTGVAQATSVDRGYGFSLVSFLEAAADPLVI